MKRIFTYLLFFTLAFTFVGCDAIDELTDQLPRITQVDDAKLTYNVGDEEPDWTALVNIDEVENVAFDLEVVENVDMNTPGTYTVKYKLMGADAVEIQSLDIEVTVVDPNAPTLSASATRVLNDSSVTITSTKNIASYSLDNGNSYTTLQTPASSFDFTPTVKGLHNIIVTDEQGGQSEVLTVYSYSTDITDVADTSELEYIVFSLEDDDELLATTVAYDVSGTSYEGVSHELVMNLVPDETNETYQVNMFVSNAEGALNDLDYVTGDFTETGVLPLGFYTETEYVDVSTGLDPYKGYKLDFESFSVNIESADYYPFSAFLITQEDNLVEVLAIDDYVLTYYDVGYTVALEDGSEHLIIENDQTVLKMEFSTFKEYLIIGGVAVEILEVSDVTDPIINVNPDGLQTTFDVGDTAPDFSTYFTAYDVVDGEIIVYDGDITGVVDMNTAGTYELYVTVTDMALNSASATITITVVDTTPVLDVAPVITDNPSGLDTTFEVGDIAPDWKNYFSVTDDVDGEILVDEAMLTYDINMLVVGSYDLAISVIDSYGNESSSVITITVADTTSPTIEFVSGETVSLTLNDPEPDWTTYFTATDNVEGTMVIAPADITENVDMSVAGTYTVTLDISDSSGNTASASITVTVA